MKKLFRKIHLWLSVPFGIFITLVCFAGSMLVYEKEITELCCPEVYFVEEVKDSPLPLEQLMERVSATLPDSVQATGITAVPDPQRTWQVSLSKPRRASVYVDPYTGEVKGKGGRLPFFDTMFHLHRWLLGASQSASGGLSAGKWLVGSSTLALVFILLTGLLMWLTNRRKPLTKSLTISVSKGFPRFWHDLHVAGGIYATLFLLLLACTGLTWSFSWYRTGFYSLFGVEASAQGGAHGAPSPAAMQEAGAGRGGHAHAEASATEGRRRGNRPQEADSLSRESGKPQGEGQEARSGRGGEGRSGRGSEGRSGEGYSRSGKGGEGRPAEGHAHSGRGGQHSPYAHWQEIYEQMAAQHPGYRQISLSRGTASVVPQGRRSLRAADRYSFDPRSGEITAVQPYADQPRDSKVRSAVYMVHVGSWGGWFTRLLTFLSALLGATLPLTGYYLWIRRLVKKGKCHKEEAHG